MRDYIKLVRNYKIGKKLFIITFVSCLFTIAGTYSNKAFQIAIDGISDLRNAIPYALTLLIIFILKDRYYKMQCKLQESLAHKYRTDMYGKILRLSINNLNDTSIGKIITAIQSAYEVVNSAIRLPYYFISIIVSIIVTLVLMFRQDIFLTIIIVIEIVPAGVMIIKLRKQVKQLTVERRESTTIMNDTISRLKSFLVIKSFAKEQFEYNRFFNQSLHRKQIIMNNKYSVYKVTNVFRLVSYLVNLTIIIYGFYKSDTGQFTIGEVLMFSMLIDNLIAPFDELPNLIDELTSLLVNMKNNQMILDMEDEYDGTIELKSFNNDIILDDIVFKYDDSNNILQNVSLNIKKGMKIGIYGESGAGKSSLVNLLMRFFKVNDGRILIDGVNINEFTNESLRRKIGIVNQDIQLFSDMTVKENISYGISGCTDVEISEAAKKANCHNFIMNLPDGYNSKIGNDGVKLSGGERQRISIARLFLLNPDILILDEATSKLDNMSEDLIKESIDLLSKDKTVISIAHRFTTIENSDLLVGIENHTIVEMGTKESLNKEGTLFSKLYRK